MHGVVAFFFYKKKVEHQHVNKYVNKLGHHTKLKDIKNAFSKD